MSEYVIYYSIVLIYGLLIGSFLNVCILRIPTGRSVVTGRSMCNQCHTLIRWYDLIPVFSYLFLRGKCRSCETKISVQYPIIEAFNGLFYVLVFYYHGWNMVSVIYCLVISALIVLSVIDFRTKTIPFGINIFIFLLGLLRVILDIQNFYIYVIGFFAVSSLLFLIQFVTKGKGMGGGDGKLMAAAGLVLGWKLILLAFILGCIYGAVIHLLRMKVQNVGRELAFGPYLSAGIVTAILIGNDVINWYLTTYL